MTLVVIKIVTLNNYEVVWFQSIVVAAMLLVVKKENHVDLLERWKDDQTL